MADYISREELKSRIRSKFPSLEDRCIINEIVNSVPAADVRPVVRGKWIKVPKTWHEYPFYKCPFCGKEFGFRSHFCPNCGADMREATP